MNASDFKARIRQLRHDLMTRRDHNGIPLYKEPPELKAVLHFETWREIIATLEPADTPQLMTERPFGCLIEQTTSLPVGELRISKL